MGTYLLSTNRQRVQALLIAALLGAAPAVAECPDSDEIVRRIAALDVSRSSRISRFEAPMPEALYRKAARKLETPAVDRVKKKGFGVLVTELPFEQWWQALNDENRHAGYVPVGHSEVLGGTVRGENRVVFQYAKLFGTGRWWVSRVRMNAELFRTSDGRMWEFWWKDEFEAFDAELPPVSEVSDDLPPIEWSRGSWMLVSLGDGCTLVELFNWTRAGGTVGALEGLATSRSLRSTLNGIRRLADELDPEIPELDPPFIRPDGSRLPPAGPAQSAE